jgi:hypothetical protein
MTKHLRKIVVGLLVLFFMCAPASVTPGVNISASAAQAEQKEVKVWVNTRSGVYHCPGSRWYGKTKEGKYMGECAAAKAGFRPAYGKPCGSDCK